MAKSSPRRLGTDLKSISSLGNRPTEAMKLATTLLYAMTVLFGLVYIISVGTDDSSDAGEGEMRQKTFSYLCVITFSALVLFILEFYASLNALMKLFRLGVLLLLIIFVGISVSPVVGLSDGENSTVNGIIYSFACLTLGFAGISGLLNLLEIFKNSGY